jgi:hypothetical protein
MFFVLKFELILIIGSNNVLMEGARKVYRGRRVGQGWSIGLWDINDHKVIRKKKQVKLSPWKPIGLWDVKDPTLSDNRLIDGGKVVSPTNQPHFTPQKHYFC